VLVLARFSGLLPADVHLVSRAESAAPHHFALAKSLNIRSSVAGSRSGHRLGIPCRIRRPAPADYHITVFDYSDVLRIDAEVSPPGYTGLPTQRIEDTRHVSCVEGSAITLICRVNKPVSRAWLADDTGNELDLSAIPSDTTDYRRTMTLNRTERYSVHLVDSEGRTNKLAPEITLTALPDRPPELVLKFPGRDVRASALEEVALEAQAWTTSESPRTVL